MHVIIGVVNKLPINLKRAWVEYAVQIEQQTGERARFLGLSKFVTEKSRIANSTRIFVRETFQANYKPRRESAYVVDNFLTYEEKHKCVKAVTTSLVTANRVTNV